MSARLEFGGIVPHEYNDEEISQKLNDFLKHSSIEERMERDPYLKQKCMFPNEETDIVSGFFSTKDIPVSDETFRDELREASENIKNRDILKLIKLLVKLTPNDMELGAKIRQTINEIK